MNNSLPPSIPDLRHDVWTLVGQIPAGRVTTYGDLARALGDLEASRFVGRLMLDHDHDRRCRCHRLVRADGSLGRYISGDSKQKAERLRRERVPVLDDRVPLEEVRWNHFCSTASLQVLAEYQRDVASMASTTNSVEAEPQIVGGLDVSFVPKSSLAVAALVAFDVASRSIVYHVTHTALVRFPYISGYLAFRELPLLMDLLDRLGSQRALPEVIMVDGSGILHPRRAGIATMLGVAAGVRTLGLTKKWLFGSVDQSRLREVGYCGIHVAGELWGHAMLGGSGKPRPWYVSPGHGISPDTALQVMRNCDLGRRLPEPIYWADRISRAAARSSESGKR